ncbi:MAG: 5'/3'-nucleotidase SurE [Leptolyngbya sp. SIO4C1]|nr:5'/3'-nucleotidase SurE [Leptolyngbya sp. SIO4C1]
MIILTNDDGIEAPGIRALQAAIDSSPSAIVAPDRHLSGCSHQINRGGPITIERRAEHEYAIGGTPADCTRVALSHLYPKAQWVLSGINAGGNLGSDIYVSGTVAAVREAALMRVPGIAISHYIHQRQPIDWGWAAQATARVLDKLMSEPHQPGRFWNVNLPHRQRHQPDPKIVFCTPCTQPLPTAYEIRDSQFYYTGAYGSRLRDAGADVEVCFDGNISVSEIRLW